MSGRATNRSARSSENAGESVGESLGGAAIGIVRSNRVIFAVARAGRPGRRQPGTRAGGRARGAGASAAI
jgi:hypothetical protein